MNAIDLPIEAGGREIEGGEAESAMPHNWREVVRLSLMVFVPLAVLVSLMAALFLDSQIKAERAVGDFRERQRVLKREEIARHGIQRAVSDLLYLAGEIEIHSRRQSLAEAKLFLDTELELFSKRSQVYREISLSGPDGQEISGGGLLHGQPHSAAKRAILAKLATLKPGEFYISPYFREHAFNRHTMIFAMGIFGGDGQRRGLLMLDFDVGSLLEEIKAATPAAPGNEMLLDDRGVPMYALVDEAEAGAGVAPLSADAWQRMQASESGQLFAREGMLTYATFHPMRTGIEAAHSMDKDGWFEKLAPGLGHHPWKIVSIVTPEMLGAESRRLRDELLPFYAGLLLLLAGGAWTWATKSVRQRVAAARLAQERMLRAQITAGAELANVTLQSIGDAVVTTDVEGRVLYLNPVAEQLTGWRNADAQGRAFSHLCMLLNETTRQPLESPVLKALREGVVAGLPAGTVMVRCDGGQLAVRNTAAPIRDTAGNIIGAVAVMQDITARREVERQLEQLYNESMRVAGELEQANVRLKQSEQRFRVAFGASPDVTLISRMSDGLFIDVNRAFLEFFGYRREEVIGRTSLELGIWPNPDDRAAIMHTLVSAGSFHGEVIQRIKSGEIKTVLCSAELVEMDDKPHLLAVGHDITARKRMEEALREGKKHLHAIVDNVIDGIVTIDGHGVIGTINPAACRIFGYTPQEVVGHNVSMLMPEPDRSQHDAYLGNYLDGGEAQVIGSGREVTAQRKDGTLFPMELAVTEIEVDGKRGFVGVVRDITQRKEADQCLAFMAKHDHLTGLANRVMFHDHLRQALARAKRNERKVAVMFIDLDHFKSINDLLGHEAGDQLLQEVAKRLKECVRDSDVVARLGGDEFSVIMEDIDQEADAARAAEAILKAMKQPVTLNKQKLMLTVSIGIAMCPQSGEEAETLLRHADIAMYGIKEGGRDDYQFYDPELFAGQEFVTDAQGRLFDGT